ncbi:nucleobindin-2-like [Paramacrobiotus metropolitanus]|uniref:nucleobindin-2-like n=1 Tax=Paramacrobiotus metropolitanus TaxID=2943436 RepID=UPI0024459760|nr:nucleobindin-2-like [Paramacrobiotus metropolitanus]
MELLWQILGLLSLIIWKCQGLPVTMTTMPPEPASRNSTIEDWDSGLEYDRYLKEIVNILEADPAFRKKMESADPEHFKTGEIANELNFVSHNLRSKLDEVKRQELNRLRALVKEQVDRNDMKELKIPAHLDPSKDNFDEEDLKRLIKQTTADLQAADEKRRQEFQNYEMEKEHQRREKLKAMDERTKQEEERKFEDMKKKHKEHPAVHHPGSKAQLEEVWEESDGLPKEEFEPKTFFKLHDLNEDHILDQGELEALFQKELDKVYDPNAPEDDMRERSEEMARMREHVMKEIDTNRDGMISLDEFMTQAKKAEFQDDSTWQTLDQQPLYSDEALREYERQLASHDQNYRYPPQYGNGPQGGGYPQGGGGYGQYPGQGPPQGYNPGGYGQYPGNQPHMQQQPYQQQQQWQNQQQGYNPNQQGYNTNQQQQGYNNQQQQGYNQQQPNSNYQNVGGTPAPYVQQGNPSQFQPQGGQYGGQPNQQYNNQQSNQYNQQTNQQGYGQNPPSQQGYNSVVPGQFQQPVGSASTVAPKNTDPNSVHSANVAGGQHR